ncbi:MAG: hypothetical protein EAY72_00530 [Bacteroidetes bacterium]|nr:MAG: hypothetical protein EAY72_00530 [Bacteroidota bacterium]
MKTTIDEFKKEVAAINSLVKKHFKQFEKPNQLLMTDGVVNIEEYYKSPIKIMWILKEPYDREDNDGGGWSMSEALNNGKLGNGKDSSTWQPIIYSTYGILNNYMKYEKMPKLSETKDMNLILRQIAFINVQKLPAKTRTSASSLKNAYQQNKEILLAQIATYKPDIIIGGKTLHLFKQDLKITQDNELKFGHFSKDKTLFINTFHPAQTKITKSEYVNTIIERAKQYKHIYA